MYININNSRCYAYTGTRHPRGDLPTVVFVHGASMDHTVWAHQSRYFAYHGYNVLAIDLPGHKFSQGDLLPSIASLAAWLNQIIAQAAGAGFHIVGHSMGALIALEAAAGFNHPASALHSLALIGFSYPMLVTPQLLDAAENDPGRAYSMMTQWSHASAIGGEPVPGFWSAGMQMSMMHSSREGSIFFDLTACHQYRGGEAAFAKVNCPILFLSGRQDKMAPAKLAKVEADKNARAEIVLLEHCGHSLMSESPDGVLDELKRFIGSHGD